MDNLEDVSEIQIASKSWEKAVESAKKTGYREGIDAGSESILQDGFDIGYAEAFKTSFALGKYKALATDLPKEVNLTPEIKEILNMSRRGACQLCKTESQVSTRKQTEEKSIKELISTQRKHSIQTIRNLYEYFEPLFKKYELSVDDLPHPDKDL